MLIYFVMDVVIVLVLLMIMKWLIGVFRKYLVIEELGVKDNFVFGISIVGGMLLLCIVLSLVVGCYIGVGYKEVVIGMVIFGIVGIILVKFGCFVYDKLVFNKVDMYVMIVERSVSVVLVDVVSLVVSVIVLCNIMVWVDGSDMNVIIVIVIGFIVVLIMLFVMMCILEFRYVRDN